MDRLPRNVIIKLLTYLKIHSKSEKRYQLYYKVSP